MTKTENRKKLIIIAVCLCISLMVPVSQRARSYRLGKQIDNLQAKVVCLNGEKSILKAKIAKMNTVESILSKSEENSITLKQLAQNSSMVASN